LGEVGEALYEELAKAFSSGHAFAEFRVWLAVDVDEEGNAAGEYVEVEVRGAGTGRDVVEVCDCRNCVCECAEEQRFGIEGVARVRSEGELRRIAEAIAGIVRRNYGGGFEGDVEALRRMGFDVVVIAPSPGQQCYEDWW